MPMCALLLSGCATSSSAPGAGTPKTSIEPPARESVAVSETGSCAIFGDAEITCWGNTPVGDGRSGTVTAETALRTLAINGSTVCAVDANRSLICWGSTFENTDTSDRPSGGWAPESLETIEFQDIGLGHAHLCGLTTNGDLRCVGEGVVQHAIDSRDHVGQAAPPSGTYRRIAAGDDRSCAIAEDGDIECWGEKLPQHEQSTHLDGEFIDVDIGARTVCGVTTSGEIRCRGLGTDPDWYEHEFDYDQGVPPPGRYRQVTTARSHTCAVTAEGHLRCWGLGAHDKRREGEEDYDQAEPAPHRAESVVTGAYHSCARLSDEDGIECWGAGQLPDDADAAVRHGYGQSLVPEELRSESSDD
jgi:alpha-tubulin suppressor-like RCC1 family protein